MEKKIISAKGERAAIGGYLPQFDEFAWFVYLNLINKELEWIRIADPEAEKLDDIQYSTHSEIHAYQVKWTISDANISFTDFINLLPVIASSWKKIKEANPNKKIIPHLITNKQPSSKDSLKDEEIKIGSFNNFIFEVWMKIQSNQVIEDKWKPIITKLKNSTKLGNSDFNQFIKCFVFEHSYKKKDFKVKNAHHSKEEQDLVKLSRFLFEEAGGTERNVEFSRHKIIQRLGWSNRFKTNFNHELIVDRQRYQPIQSTIDLLNLKLTEHKNGYLFLQGGPGSGKSTLLNQWSKGVNARIIKYFAFDFVNPSSHLNYHDRGDSTHLFFDLVFQIKEAGIYKRDILPYKNLLFLKEVFNEQLKAIQQKFIKDAQPTIIIIDGLDHVPREYKSTTNSFLRELPSPLSLPEGVFIILGSQSYQLEDIHQAIKTEYQRGQRTILINLLKKEEVYEYINSLDSLIQLNTTQKLRIFEKSQGHPLYLSYLIEKINETDSIDNTIDAFVEFDGSIDNYYNRIWEPVQKEESLIHLLGLLTRINGSININFIHEWKFNRSVLKSFREKARVLFNETNKELSFFHNSFKQFLLHETSIDYLTGEFDEQTNIDYHIELADYYIKSEVEKPWKQNQHLFLAKQYDSFVLKATPDSFTSQLLNFRPIEEIKQDSKLGIEIAIKTKNINTLVKYLFSLAEIEKRLQFINPASLTKELLTLNKHVHARDYLRTGNILHCNETYAFKAALLFNEFGHKHEATTLFNLAYPEIITEFGITIKDDHTYEEIKETLEEWIYTSPYFESTEKIFSKIKRINFPVNPKNIRPEENKGNLLLALLTNLGYSLINQNKWNDFNQVIEKINKKSREGKNSLFQLLNHSVEYCIKSNDHGHAIIYLSFLTNSFTKEKSSPIGKIYIADLIYKVTGDTVETYNWIKGIKQPLNIEKNELGYDVSLDEFLPLIKLNKLLNICKKGISITSAVPSTTKVNDKTVLVEFERMLCIISQILGEGITQKQTHTDLLKRLHPIIRFYYKEVSPKNNYWFKLKKMKGQYFNFLISAVYELGGDNIEKLGDYLFNEFSLNPKYWNENTQRKIIKSLFAHGFNRKKSITQLRRLENSMLDNYDVDGRITECSQHSELWMILDEPVETEKWLKKTIQESIGIGYRKDYQFSTWIEWLRKINKSDSLNAIERIKWFLSHINHLKEITEGRAYVKASKELLETTFEHNLSDGLEQTIWQLENHLIDFNNSLSLFIEYFVKRITSKHELVSILELYNNLYLLLTESSDSNLLKSIMKKGYEILDKEFLIKYVPKIISAINIKLYEENRAYLISEIDIFFSSKDLKLSNYYLEFKPSVENKNTSTSNSLTLKKDYKTIMEIEVLEKIKTFDDFKKIIQEEDQANSHFDWSKVIVKISPLLSLSKIEEIQEIAKIENKGSEFFAKLSNVAFDLGDKNLATNLANESLELSSKAGWIKFYDGGTRIKAFQALRKLDVKQSSNKAFEVFAHDILSEGYTNSYIEHLEDIIPLITENFKEEDIWTEIFGYSQRLMSNSKPIENLPILPSLNKPIMETLVDYLIYLSKNPITLIKEQSIQLLAKYINQNNAYALTQLSNEKIDNDTTLDIIISLALINSPKIYEIKSNIQKLSLSKNYLIRVNSKKILHQMKVDIPAPANILLPRSYSLYIPDLNKPILDKEIDFNIPNIDVNNLKDLVSPFEYFIKILSKESGIKQSNLFYRVSTIMKKIGDSKKWSAEYEKKLRNHLEEINLKYSYIRPRVITARRAIMFMTTELIDSKTIIDDERIQNIFKSHDYSVSHFKETRKPDFIKTIKERDSGGVNQKWLERIDESQRLTEDILCIKNDFNIVAEYNKIRTLEWGTPTEEYMTQIDFNKDIDKDSSYIFTSVFHQLSENYYELDNYESSIIVVRDHQFDQFNLKSNWIAINPKLARYLKWVPEPSKLFSWKNYKDELMAESVYWSNGNFDLRPHKNGEVGEGWYVQVSKQALAQIKSLNKKLFIKKKISRSRYNNSNLIKNDIFRIIEIK